MESETVENLNNEKFRCGDLFINYAGPWRRLFAYLMDLMILFFISFIINFAIGFVRSFGTSMFYHPSPVLPSPAFWQFAGLSTYWLYYALFESSSWQATIGKKLLHLQVTNLQGERISFGRASARHFGKMVSCCFVFFGLIMIFFTKKKQALHDKIASTLIMQK